MFLTPVQYLSIRYDLIIQSLHNAYRGQQVFVCIVGDAKSAEEFQFGRTSMNRCLFPVDTSSSLTVIPVFVVKVHDRAVLALVWTLW